MNKRKSVFYLTIFGIIIIILSLLVHNGTLINAAAGNIYLGHFVILYGHKEVTSFFYTHDERRRISWKGIKRWKRNIWDSGWYIVFWCCLSSWQQSRFIPRKRSMSKMTVCAAFHVGRNSVWLMQIIQTKRRWSEVR